MVLEASEAASGADPKCPWQAGRWCARDGVYGCVLRNGLAGQEQSGGHRLKEGRVLRGECLVQVGDLQKKSRRRLAWYLGDTAMTCT